MLWPPPSWIEFPYFELEKLGFLIDPLPPLWMISLFMHFIFFYGFPYYYFIDGSLFREMMCHGRSFKSCFDEVNLHYVLLISIKLHIILHLMNVFSQLLKVLHLLFCQFANVSQPHISVVDICKCCSSIFQIGQTQFIWLKLAKTYINLHCPHLIYRGLTASNG